MSVIATNVQSLNTQSSLGAANNAMDTAMERLSSGSKVNSAKDDAAGLAISERMVSQLNGMDVAQRNAEDGVSMLQTAEGGLNTTGDILQRMREIAVQAENGSYGEDDIDALGAEFDQLKEEIEYVTENTYFNGIQLLSGDDSISLQIGANAGETLEVDKVNLDNLLDEIGDLGADVPDGEDTVIESIDEAIQTVSDGRADLGANMNRLEYRIQDLDTASINLEESKSRIVDADMSSEMSNFTKEQILSQSSTAMLAQANQRPQNIMQLIQ